MDEHGEKSGQHPTTDAQHKIAGKDFDVKDDMNSAGMPGLKQHSAIEDELERHLRIDDRYESLEQVTEALQQAGIITCAGFITGIDFTKSNEWNGERSFSGQSLHQIGSNPNPYEQVISIIGKTLSPMVENNFIHCFGFGDESTRDRDVFSFYPDQRPCKGYREVLDRYVEIVPQLTLAEPKCFAPVIEMAVNITERSGCFFHILLIVSDGQVTEDVNSEPHKRSSQEEEQCTINALVKASEYPLSVILVGVGDDPGDPMNKYKNYLSKRFFDNYQFVNFTETMSKDMPETRKEAEFASNALAKVPLQHAYAQDLGILGNQFASCIERIPLLPPFAGFVEASSGISPLRPIVERSMRSTSGYTSRRVALNPFLAESFPYNKVCQKCSLRMKDMALGCGHEVCQRCLKCVEKCPICKCVVRLKSELARGL